MTKVLLIGNLEDDKWLGSLVRSVKQCDPEIQIDFFNTHIKGARISPFSPLCNHIFSAKKNFPDYLYQIPKLRGMIFRQDIQREFDRLINHLNSINYKYDLVNIHFLTPILYSCFDRISKISKYTLLTPWGSDVLRVNRRQQEKLSVMCDKADYISCGQNRFRKDIISLLRVPEKKIITMGLGTEMIDVINNHPEINQDVAKEKLDISGKYVIVCGYNAHRAQNHIQIIESIAEQKEQLPPNILLLFPMTYGIDKDYINSIEKKLIKLHLPYKILRHYLSNEQLLFVRKCADIFVHAQTTDANSGSLAEFLLCKTKIINASWLSYPHKEKYGMPYYIFDSFDSLGKVLVQAYRNDTCLVSDLLIEDILKEGWSQVGTLWANFYNTCASKQNEF